MARIQVRPVRTAKDLRAFVDLAWDVYRCDPNWVPPLKSEQARLLTPGRHPFWNLAERELFLAERECRAVGRIAAIVDHNANRHQSVHMGVWGFFVYRGEEPVAVCLLLPDLNPLLKRLDGRLGLVGLLKRFVYRRAITGLRALLLGIKEAYRQAGVPFVVLGHLQLVLAKRPQYRYVEMGWSLEDNPAINLLFEDGGLRPHKRYRVYRKELPERAEV